MANCFGILLDEKMQIGIKKSSKVRVSRVALSRRECAGKDYRIPLCDLLKKKRNIRKKQK